MLRWDNIDASMGGGKCWTCCSDFCEDFYFDFLGLFLFYFRTFVKEKEGDKKICMINMVRS
tara:strand:- start:247 stop:429 length:183 start_codon:yes stop_codon:yes gene_type:complete